MQSLETYLTRLDIQFYFVAYQSMTYPLVNLSSRVQGEKTSCKQLDINEGLNEIESCKDTTIIE